jgi:hypothetical protein
MQSNLCMYLCTCVNIGLCMYIHLYIYIYIYTYIHLFMYEGQKTLLTRHTPTRASNWFGLMWTSFISLALRRIRGGYAEDPRSSTTEDTSRGAHVKESHQFTVWNCRADWTGYCTWTAEELRRMCRGSAEELCGRYELVRHGTGN